MLPQDVIHQAKRSLLDTLGCAIGAYDAPGRPICEAVAQELAGPQEATLWGSGQYTSALNATLVNGFLVRFLDFNDMGGGGHNSDAIPSIIAVTEREKAGGQALLTSIVISYELGARVAAALLPVDALKALWAEEGGFNVDVRGGLSMPPALGKLAGLNEDQIANAIGICTSHSISLGILDADTEENTMTKNLRFAFPAYDAIMACTFAKHGFTGPIRIVEGHKGFNQTCFDNKMNLDQLVDFSGWRILNTKHKSIAVQSTTQGHVLATLGIVLEHDLKPDEIASIRIKQGARDFRHTACLEKKYPINAETGDHSTFFTNAIAIKERSLYPDSFLPEKYTDPVVVELIEKITAEVDPSLPPFGCAGISEIITKDGRKFEKRVDIPHGFGDDPLSDDELEDKFTKMASKYMDQERIQKIIETVYGVDKLGDIGELTKLMVFQSC
jgi:2-methylcitrate dehydratase